MRERRALEPDAFGVCPVAALCPACNHPVAELFLDENGRPAPYFSSNTHAGKVEPLARQQRQMYQTMVASGQWPKDVAPLDPDRPDVKLDPGSRPQRAGLQQDMKWSGFTGARSGPWHGRCRCGKATFVVGEAKLADLIRLARDAGAGDFYLPRWRQAAKILP